MVKLETVSVRLRLPFVGEVAGTWAPDDAERRAAWEMYVELATRVTVVQLAPGEGLLREALASLYSLFGTTRTILREHGPDVARTHRDGTVSFGSLALSVLNGALRPLLSRWHPELAAYEQQRPPGESVTRWERSWDQAEELRGQIETTRLALVEYANLLAAAADVPPLRIDGTGAA